MLTLSRGLTFFDSGELALVGQSFGLGHPPGQPLYTLILGIVSWAFADDALVAMTAVSASAAALCALPANALMLRLTAASPIVRCLLIVACGSLYPVWDQATRIELYAPMTLMIMTSIAWAAKVIDDEDCAPTTWFGLGLLVGLTVCVNALQAIGCALAIGLGSAVFLWRQSPKTLLQAILSAFLGTCCGLLPYSYLYFVAGKTDRFVWGDFSTSEGVWHYLTGADYAGKTHDAWHLIPAQFGEWLVWMSESGGAIFIILGIIGLGLNPRLKRLWPLWLVPILVGLVFTFSYGERLYHPEVPDYSGYLLPGLWWLSIALAGLLSRLPGRIAPILAVFLLLWPMARFLRILPDRSDDRVAIELAQNYLESLPEEAILVMESDHLVFPTMYLQEMQSLRPDVVLVNTGLLTHSWYWERLYTQHRLRGFSAPREPTLRLYAFLRTNQDRPLHAEHGQIHELRNPRTGKRLTTCPSVWGVKVGKRNCARYKSQPNRLLKQMEAWWEDQQDEDPIARRVMTHVGRYQALAYLQRLETEHALRVIQASLPPDLGSLLPRPKKMTPMNPLPPGYRPSFLGAPDVDTLLMGTAILKAQPSIEGQECAEVWETALKAISENQNPRSESRGSTL